MEYLSQLQFQYSKCFGKRKLIAENQNSPMQKTIKQFSTKEGCFLTELKGSHLQDSLHYIVVERRARTDGFRVISS